jgi:aspartate racemase
MFGVGELMLSSAKKLAAGGAQILICPDNTIHQAMDHVRPRSPLPWLHIAEVVAEEARRRGFSRIGITGTRWLVESDVYPAACLAAGLDFVRPDGVDCAEMQRIIMSELVLGVFKPDSIRSFIAILARLKARGCDAVALGCTEIPLIIDKENSPLPPLDSTRLLARAALRWAVGQP